MSLLNLTGIDDMATSDSRGLSWGTFAYAQRIPRSGIAWQDESALPVGPIDREAYYANESGPWLTFRHPRGRMPDEETTTLYIGCLYCPAL